MSRGPVLYDAPGPRARLRHRAYGAAAAVLLAAAAAYVYVRFDRTGQWEARRWTPFLRGEVWRTYLLPGLRGTLRATAAAGVLAVCFGTAFGLARLSVRRWLRVPAGAVVELFRAIPVLLMIFFAFYGAFALTGRSITPFTAVVLGLTLYNGSVLAEIVRAGVLAVPRGQSEAALALGLTGSQVMRLVLLPQAARSMMPAIVSQLVVLLKDSALGYIIGYGELLNSVSQIGSALGNMVAASVVVGAMYVVLNATLGRLARWLERRLSRRRVPGAATDAAPATPVAA